MRRTCAASPINPFRQAGGTPFIVGAPQEEALARLEYVRDHGGGLCEITGPRGIGKSALLAELARRAQRCGETWTSQELGVIAHADWLLLLAEAWQPGISAATASLDVHRTLQEHIVGMAAMNRPAWLLIELAEERSQELTRGCRWLSRLAMRHQLSLTVVAACRDDAEAPAQSEETELRLELWPWESDDCRRLIEACCKAVGRTNPFTADAVALLAEWSGGIPQKALQLAEWAWLAAEAESLAEIGPELIHAVAEELTPRRPRRAAYEASAAYGAW